MSRRSVKARSLIERLGGSAFHARNAAAYLIASHVAEGLQPPTDTVHAFRVLDRLVEVQQHTAATS